MKKLLLFLFLIPIFAKSQVTPQQIDACKGVASGQNSYSVTISCNSFPTSTYQMEKICVTYTITNTGAATLKVNNQSPVAITLGGTALAASDIVANQPYIMIYDNIGSKWTLQKPSGSGGVAVSSVSADPPLASSGGSTPTVTITQSAASTDGYLSSTDWNSFNDKVSSPWILASSPTTAITYTIGDVGINTMTTTASLHVVGSGITSATFVAKFFDNSGTNNLFAIRNDGFIDAGNSMLFNMTIGNNSGFNPATTSNTFVGIGIAPSIAGGNGNTAIGHYVLNQHLTGDYNTSIGFESLFSQTGATGNTAIGYDALYSNLTATDLTAVGRNALKLSTGQSNTAIGSGSMAALVTGAENTALGAQSMLQATSGTENTSIGDATFFQKTSGNLNTSIGYAAGFANVSGSGNIFIGALAGRYETGSNRFMVDNQARTDEQTSRNSSPLQVLISSTVADQIVIVNSKLYMKDTITPFHYYSIVVVSGVLVLTDTGSADAP